ncbi:MAG TPA: NAD-dependent epimerase/dehydratase family protein [Acetobacteraceae bacterium]|nr:NAD-dependent epimerase/dehydratase family protein [Acetobacteraceae bacterium]
MPILLTGAAGFIGFHIATALLGRGEQIIGVDDLNPYYDVRLKQARLSQLIERRNFCFHQIDIADRSSMAALAARESGITRIVHLAAQAGVRHSLTDPHAYVSANMMGHLVVLEAARALPHLEHLVFASSSSVYGANSALPFAEQDRVDTPQSLYAASKLADELMSYSYAHLFGIRQTALRFFTVYGPWGRPDMAYYSFANAIMKGEPITLYDGGTLRRDFTYIDDIVTGVLGVLDRPPENVPPMRVLNIGNHRSEPVSALVALLERELGHRADIRFAARPPADVVETFADITRIAELTGFAPATPLEAGIPRFVAWFRRWRNG